MNTQTTQLAASIADAPLFTSDRLTDAFPDSPEIVAEILGSFLQHLKRLQVKFNGSITLASQSLIAHSIKGCAAECGANKLRHQANLIENACSEGNMFLLRQELPVFNALFDDTFQAIDEWLAEFKASA